MAISNAISIKVGFENGAKNYKELKNYAYAGIGVSMLFMTICAFIFLIIPQKCIELFTSDLEVIKVAVPILTLVGLFQIFDGLQVSVSGVFKGLKKTTIIMIGIFIAYWIIGLPLGFLLAFKYNQNLYGFWIGITISIASLGIGLYFTMKKLFRKLN
jgi:MATE family multidrug resistance protein